MKTVRSLLAVMVFCALLAPAAQASHPTQICLDVESDTRYAIYNEGPDYEYEALVAEVGESDAGHPPAQGGCVVDQEAVYVGGIEIDFETTGAGDPDAADSPESPDMTCVIDSANDCSVIPPESAEGEQTIAAWIDWDEDDSTVELDRAEGYDEASAPGDLAEPDATDVALWRWAQCHGCLGLSITFDPEDDRFRGRVFEHYSNCVAKRVVKVRKERPGRDRIMGKATTGPRGIWSIAAPVATRGRFYAVAPAFSSEKYGDCPRIESETITVTN